MIIPYRRYRIPDGRKVGGAVTIFSPTINIVTQYETRIVRLIRNFQNPNLLTLRRCKEVFFVT